MCAVASALGGLSHRLLGGQRLRMADYVLGTGFADGSIVDLREFRSNSQIPTVFPHRFPVNSHALTSGEGLLERMRKARQFYLEGEASRT